MPSARQNFVAVVVGAVLLSAIGWRAVATSGRGLDAGFWFEPVTYGQREAMVERLGGPLTGEEIDAIRAGAFAEVARAFADLPIALSDQHDATYRVRVVQELRNARAPRYPGPAGESRAVAGWGGQGAVNFRALVSSAVAYAPAGADRATIVEAIGRGIGRTAVHEFAHQFLGTAPIDATEDRLSYEYRSADRAEQFYGDLHWAHAWPLLRRRLRVATE